MNRSLLLTGALALLGLGAAAQAAEETVRAESLTGSGYEQVDAFTAFRGPHSFSVLDDRTLIVWATPFQPYLVELKYPSHDLKWAHAIGVTQFGSRISKFDSVQVRGFRYPIGGIYKLTREQAKELRSTRT